MPDDTKLPATQAQASAALPAEFESTRAMPLAMRIWFDDNLFERAKTIAKYLSDAKGFVPDHLAGKPHACFAVVVRSLTWRLDPYAVAAATYETPGGKVGYEGRLCIAVLENSGKIEGNLKFEHHGDWSKVQGKFTLRESQKSGKPYPVPAWKHEDEAGLKVVVSAKVKGEVEPRTLEMELVQCHPRNSTLWATDPKTQICYTAARRFASVAAAGLFMGVPFDREDEAAMIDVTPPRPQRGDFEAAQPEKPTVTDAAVTTEKKPAAAYDVVGMDGEVTPLTQASQAATCFQEKMTAAAKVSADALTGVWESNSAFLSILREQDKGPTADMLGDFYGKLLDETEAKERDAKVKAAEASKPAQATQPQAAKEQPANRQKKAPAKETPAQQPAQVTPAAKEATTAIAKWSPVPDPDYAKPPTCPTKGGNVLAFMPWFVKQLRNMPREQIADFLSKENYGDFYDLLAARRPEDKQAIDELIDGRNVKP